MRLKSGKRTVRCQIFAFQNIYLLEFRSEKFNVIIMKILYYFEYQVRIVTACRQRYIWNFDVLFKIQNSAHYGELCCFIVYYLYLFSLSYFFSLCVCVQQSNHYCSSTKSDERYHTTLTFLLTVFLSTIYFTFKREKD